MPVTINSHLAAWVAAAVFLGCLPDAAAKARAPRQGKAPHPAPADGKPAVPDRGPVDLRLHEIISRNDPVPFRHAAHLAHAGLDGCATCHHHAAAETKPVARCTSCHAGRDAAMEAYHGLCKGCHVRVPVEDRLKAPTTCAGGGCHAPLVLSLPDAQQPPVRFDHHAHRVSRPQGDCQPCHHADAPDAAQRGCLPCHAADGQAAYHKLCIGCHVETAAEPRPEVPNAKPVPRTTRCAACHGAVKGGSSAANWRP